MSSFFVPCSDAVSLHESVQIAILKTSGADSSAPHGSCAGDFSSNEGSAPLKQQVVVFTESSTYAVRQCEAEASTPHRRAAQTEFLNIAQASEIKFVQVLAEPDNEPC